MNLVILMSDEHNRNVLGCYGHPFVQTPNLDRLAAQGTMFSDAYCNSPICVPSRASFATGRYVHQTGHWDNAHPYCGTPLSWHHAVRDAGFDSVSIGKLHFRGGDDNGFSEEILPLHVLNGIGDLKGLVRRPLPDKKGAEAMARDAGRGESGYCRYDKAIRDSAVSWIRQNRATGRPFVLFVSFVMPHFPLVAPAEFYDLYEHLPLAALREGLDAPPPDHPALRETRRYMGYDQHFDDTRRAIGLRAYFGMVSAIDAFAGEILDELDRDGAQDTAVIYTSDHGEGLGNHGFWGKSTMYEDSVTVPLILRGPGVSAGHRCATPVSLIDIFPTVLDATGADGPDDLPGRSLFELARGADEPDRSVFSEYHAAGAPTGVFMLRRGRMKLIEYAGMVPQLFDLKADPGEMNDLASDPAHAAALDELRREMRRICDPEAVNQQVFRDQQRKIEEHGGVETVLRGIDIPHTPAPETTTSR